MRLAAIILALPFVASFGTVSDLPLLGAGGKKTWIDPDTGWEMEEASYSVVQGYKTPEYITELEHVVVGIAWAYGGLGIVASALILVSHWIHSYAIAAIAAATAGATASISLSGGVVVSGALTYGNTGLIAASTAIGLAGAALSAVLVAAVVITGIVLAAIYWNEIIEAFNFFDSGHNCLNMDEMEKWGSNLPEDVRMQLFEDPPATTENWTPKKSTNCYLDLDDCGGGYPCQVNRYIKPPAWMVMGTPKGKRHSTWDAEDDKHGVYLDNSGCPSCTKEVLQTPRALRWAIWDAGDDDDCTCDGYKSAPAHVKRKVKEEFPEWVKPIIYRCPTLYEVMRSPLPSSLEPTAISQVLHRMWDDPSQTSASDGGCTFDKIEREGSWDTDRYCGTWGKDREWAFGAKEVPVPGGEGQVVLQNYALGLLDKLSPEDRDRVTSTVKGIDIPCYTRPMAYFIPAFERAVEQSESEDNARKADELFLRCRNDPAECAAPANSPVLLQPGEECYKDAECENDYCGRYDHDGSCKDGGCYCCPLPDFVNGYPADWCTNLPNGEKCKHDAQCGDGTGKCNSDTGKCEGAEPKVKDGEPCAQETNTQCENDFCGRYNEASDYYCCPSADFLAGYPSDWCTEVPVNGACKYDAQCADGGICHDEEGYCLEKKNAGEKCPTEDNDECFNEHCGRYNEDSDYYCCPVADFLNGYPSDWCNWLEDGTACKYDAQCKSNLCKDGKCRAKQARGAECSAADNDECQNGYCGRYNEDSAYHCCPFDDGGGLCVAGGRDCFADGWPDDWCAGLPDGYDCKHNNQCTGDTCMNGKCASKKPEGAYCSGWNSDCQNGECHRVDRDGNFYRCCADNYYCTAWTSGNCASTFYYCDKYSEYGDTYWGR